MKILFMCVANSARSQLAEGLARQVFPEADIRSAGSCPGNLSPYAVAVMKEIGMDISGQYSKSIDDLPAQFIAELDYLITLCGDEVCPTMATQRAKKLHWPFPDPATREPVDEAIVLERFRVCRRAIQERIIGFALEIKKA